MFFLEMFFLKTRTSERYNDEIKTQEPIGNLNDYVGRFVFFIK